MRVGQGIFSLWILYLENKMTEITLNCLIVPIGKLMNIPCIKVMQSITIYKASTYRELETVIQSRLGHHLIKSLSNSV